MNKKIILTASLFAGLINVTAQNNIGMGTANPTNKLHVVSNADPLRLEGLNNIGNNVTYSQLVSDTNGVIKLAPTDASVKVMYVSATESQALNAANYNNSVPQRVTFATSNIKLSSGGAIVLLDATDEFQIQEAGFYRIDAFLGIGYTSNATTGNGFHGVNFVIYKNGTPLSGGRFNIPNEVVVAQGNTSLQVNAVAQFAVGDKITTAIFRGLFDRVNGPGIWTSIGLGESKKIIITKL